MKLHNVNRSHYIYHGGPGVSLRMPYALFTATRFTLLPPIPSVGRQNKCESATE